MEKARRARISAKSWLTRANNTLEKLTESERSASLASCQPKQGKFSTAFREFEICLSGFDQDREEVMYLLEEDKIEGEVLEVGEYRDKAVAWRTKAEV